MFEVTNTTEPKANPAGNGSLSLNMLESWRQIQRNANPAMAPIAKEM